MPQPAIEVHNISKKYSIGKASSANTLSDLIKSLIPSKRKRKQVVKEFFALNDINLQVQQGEILGVIGRNGAGKSTLLKVLSRITVPTSGSVKINGTVNSLLEVGTGFHPDLSGRENVYLNGTIMGMSQQEVKKKFDEIVYFSGVEKFIDTPVKHYSSGMRVRLGFAVAANLSPDVLIIDEVLAVGDAAFQKKSLGKMKEVSSSGRTVLFVSHNMTSIEDLTTRCILLEKGEVVFNGAPEEATKEYYERLKDVAQEELEDTGTDETFRRGNQLANFKEVKVLEQTNQRVAYQLYINLNEDFEDLQVAMGIKAGSLSNKKLMAVTPKQLVGKNLKKGEVLQAQLEVDLSQLNDGRYSTYFWMGNERYRACDILDGLVAPLVINHSGTEFIPNAVPVTLKSAVKEVAL